MLGPVRTVDEMKVTDVAGVYAAGDILRGCRPCYQFRPFGNSIKTTVRI
jgi:thioredoxin reductase